MCTFYSFLKFGITIRNYSSGTFSGYGISPWHFFFLSELQTHNFKYLQGTSLKILWHNSALRYPTPQQCSLTPASITLLFLLYIHILHTLESLWLLPPMDYQICHFSKWLPTIPPIPTAAVSVLTSPSLAWWGQAFLYIGYFQSPRP